MVNKKRTKKDKEALEVIEEATHLLRLSPVRTFVFYYAGTGPFILGFLYFWSDMSRGSFAYQHSAQAALLMTVLFIWMKCFHVLFINQIRAAIHRDNTYNLNIRMLFRIIVAQTAIQPTGFIILPLSLLVALPFGWAYAFYQNVCYFGNGEDADIKSVYKKSLHHMMIAPGQNHLIISVVSILGIFLLLNIGILILQLPYFLKMITGTENAFTKAGLTMLFNTTYLAVTFSITYLLLDPLIKTVYALRCFYAESLETAEDLKIELKSYRPSAKNPLIMIIVTVLFSLQFSCMSAYASDTDRAEVQNPVVSSSELDSSISEIIVKREFSWRFPREKISDENKDSLFQTFIKGLMDSLVSWLKPFKKWITNIFEWLVEKLSNFDVKQERSGKQWGNTVKTLLYVLLGLIVSLLILFIVREWKQRKTPDAKERSDVVPYIPDINDENISADALPADSWLEMAQKFMEQGDTRLALRAFYLASLSHLSSLNLIKIAIFKSNHEYEKELLRNAHHKPDLLYSFSGNINIFEKIWYGMHEITEELQRDFILNQERIMANVRE